MSANRPNGKWGTDRVQTSTTGAAWVTLPAHDCDEVLLINASGVALDLRASGETGAGIKIGDAGAPALQVSGNASEIQIRRNDVAGTQVYVGFLFKKHRGP